MIRTTLGALVGWLVGVGLTVLLLWVTERGVRQLTAPRVFEIEYWVIYLAVVLGSGFGALAGALAGLASAVLRRDGSGTPGASPGAPGG